MCDTLVQVLPDRVLFAKNSDREADEPQQLEWQPRRQHRVGERLRCTHLEIPQVATTHAVLLSRPVWMWGAEMGSNEYGVTIGNEALFTRHPVAAVGLTGMDLLRLGLERATTAEEAVAVIVALHRQHGQGGRCGYEVHGFRYHSSFLIADPRRAFVVETAGPEHAVERVVGARSISNGLSIPGFAERHRDRLRTAIAAASQRRQRTEARAAAADDLRGMIAALRDHGAAPWPRYSSLTGGMKSPCMHAGGLLAAAQTTASWVAELRPGDFDRRCRHLVTATSAPCISLFKPVAVTAPLDLGPPPGLEPDGSLWWRHERLHRLTMRDPASLWPLCAAERDALEAKIIDGELAGEAAWATAVQAEQRWLDRVRAAITAAGPQRPGSRDVRPLAIRYYWRRRRPV